MNKSVITSVSPRECELIASGRQTMLVRKTRPKIETPFKDYIYCSKGKMFLYKNPNNGELFLDSNGGYRGGDYEDRFLTQKVIGEFVCDRIHAIHARYYDHGSADLTPDKLIDVYDNNSKTIDELEFEDDACLTHKELFDYTIKKDGWAYGLHISDLKIYDKPKELGEFRKSCNHINDCCTCKEAEFQYDGDELRGLICRREIPLTRPPKSWVYCEPIEEE